MFEWLVTAAVMWGKVKEVVKKVVPVFVVAAVGVIVLVGFVLMVRSC